MSGIASKLLSLWLEIAWGAFTLLNALLILVAQTPVTLPFHLIWISLSILYGYRTWGINATILVLGAVCILSAAVMVPAVMRSSHVHSEELLEIPLMGIVFAVMVWHAQRRQVASARVRRMAEKEREFVRDAAHQLRTPITIARGHAELIQAEYGAEPAGEDAAVILAELERLSKMSDRLLLLAAIEHPSFLQREQVELGRLVEDTGTRWTATAARHWFVHTSTDGLLLFVDRERIDLALDALLENAVKFTGEEDSISVAGRAEGGEAVLEVSDSGTGIPSEYLPRVFDRFARVNNHAQANGSTGLGLAIVKAIVEAHHGSISVESALGSGTTFRIRLPARQRGPASSGRTGSDRLARDEHRMTIR